MTGLVRRLAAPIAARLLKRLTGLAPSSLDPRISDRRSPQLQSLGRTGFLFHTPELLNHFSNVMELLPAGSFDLVVCRDAENSVELNIAARRWKAKVVTIREVLSARWRYDCLVSNHS